MDGESPNAHLLYTLVVHPSLWSLRLAVSIITVPLSLLLSIVLFPVRIVFLPVASSYTLFASMVTSSTNPPTPLQFLLSALFFGTIAGVFLVVASRIANAGLNVFVQANVHFPPAPSSGAKHSLVPSSQAVRKRIQQQLKQAQQLHLGLKDLPPDAAVSPIRKSPTVKLETDQHNWEDKWRQQQQDRRDAKQLLVPSPPPVSPSAGARLSPVISNLAASAAKPAPTHTIAEEDSEDDMYYDDETDGF